MGPKGAKGEQGNQGLQRNWKQCAWKNIEEGKDSGLIKVRAENSTKQEKMSFIEITVIASKESD